MGGLLSIFASGLLLDTRPLDDPERIELWERNRHDRKIQSANSEAFLSVYHPRKANGTAILICPGGGYGDLVLESEGRQTAQWLAKNGILGIVLEYRLPHGQPDIPLMDARRAIRYARAKANDWNIDPHRIGILGFSAGGHLAAMASTRFDLGNPKAEDRMKQQSSRPDFSILLYPVITMGDGTDEGTKQSLMGTDPDPDSVAYYSAEKQVTDQTPPALLIYARNDQVVSPANSDLYAQALLANQISVHQIPLPSGGHGLGYGGPLWDRWQREALHWMTAQGMIPD